MAAFGNSSGVQGSDDTTAFYTLLGVEKTATPSQLKKAFHKGALKFHPDKHRSDTEEGKERAETIFKEMAEAYAVLSDPEQRAVYDKYGQCSRGVWTPAVLPL